MSSYADRLAALREQLKSDRLDGFVVPLTDEHMSEYVGSYAQRLQWLTGFEGSAGSAVVLPEEAAIFTDGRYTLQVRAQGDRGDGGDRAGAGSTQPRRAGGPPGAPALSTAGRYTVQVRSQVDGEHWSYQSVPETSIADWLKDHAPEGGRIGYDPWLHTHDWAAQARDPPAAR